MKRRRWPIGTPLATLGRWICAPSAWLILGGILTTSIVVGTGCRCDEDDCIRCDIDLDAPAAPRGLYSITGNNQVTLVWLANTEPDVEGYDVWWNYSFEGEYSYLGTVRHDENAYEFEFVDSGAANSETYFYAVTAFDRQGNESDLSFDSVQDTPRPDGFSVVLTNAEDPGARDSAGFDLESKLIVAADDPRADFHYVHYEDNGMDHYLIQTGVWNGAWDHVQVQDMGWTDSFDEIGYAPSGGWSESGIAEAIAGHTYVLLTQEGSNGYYAKIWLRAVSSSHITFDWAYQADPWNRELSVPVVP